MAEGLCGEALLVCFGSGLRSPSVLIMSLHDPPCLIGQDEKSSQRDLCTGPERQHISLCPVVRISALVSVVWDCLWAGKEWALAVESIQLWPPAIPGAPLLLGGRNLSY